MEQGHEAELPITPKMIEAGAWALQEWVADGRSQGVHLATCELGIHAILKAMFPGKDIPEQRWSVHMIPGDVVVDMSSR